MYTYLWPRELERHQSLYLPLGCFHKPAVKRKQVEKGERSEGDVVTAHGEK